MNRVFKDLRQGGRARVRSSADDLTKIVVGSGLAKFRERLYEVFQD